LAIPARHAIPAKSGKIHHINILNIGTFLQMGNKAPECGGFKLGCCGFVHNGSACLLWR
jgi:hypothetical protein